MNVHLLAHFHDRTNLTVLLRIHHHKRLRDIALVQVIDLLGDLGCQLLVLEPAAVRVRVDHQTGVHHRVLILREMNHRLLELEAVRLYPLTDRIQTLNRLHLVRRTDTRTHQYMPAVDPVTFLLDELDDMVSVLRLHDTAHALGVVQVKSHLRKLRHQLSLTDKTQLTAAFGTLRIFRVQTR